MKQEITEAAKNYLKKIDEDDCMWTEDDKDIVKHFSLFHTQQSKQDKELIRELLEALKGSYAITPKGVPFYKDVYSKTKLAIEKANNYINQ